MPQRATGFGSRRAIARIGSGKATPNMDVIARNRTIHHLQGAHMSRKPFCTRNTLVAVAIAALSGTGTAFADDGSMSRLTGDSYAFFNNLDYSLGKFNTPRAPHAEARDAVAKGPSKIE